MAQQNGPRPRFGDAATADVTLQLLSTNEESLTLHLHSQVFLSLKIADDIVKTLAEDDLSKLLAVCGYSENATNVLLMLSHMLRAFQSEGLIISRSVRFALVKNWLPIIPNLIRRTEEFSSKKELEEGICALTKTLPQVDQSEIFKIWFETWFKERLPWPNLQVVFELSCDKLRQELEIPQKEQERPVFCHMM